MARCPPSAARVQEMADERLKMLAQMQVTFDLAADALDVALQWIADFVALRGMDGDAPRHSHDLLAAVRAARTSVEATHAKCTEKFDDVEARMEWMIAEQHPQQAPQQTPQQAPQQAPQPQHPQQAPQQAPQPQQPRRSARMAGR